MGQSRASTGKGAVDSGLLLQKRSDSDRVIALAGNPNVGKSTVFNALTNLRQHTGNWAGKTVATAQGHCSYQGQGYLFVDLPGCYSLMAHSAEEEAARDFICFQHPDAVVVVCDATCLERNLNLVLQIIEVEPKTVVCVNLLDEAEKKRLKVDLNLLQKRLGVPVIGTSARAGKGLTELLEQLNILQEQQLPDDFPGKPITLQPVQIKYDPEIEEIISILEPMVKQRFPQLRYSRWLCLRLLDADQSLETAIQNSIKEERNEVSVLTETAEVESSSLNDITEVSNIQKESSLAPITQQITTKLQERGLTREEMSDRIACQYGRMASKLLDGVVQGTERDYNQRDRRLDRVFTSKWIGFPIMCLLLLGVFWITIVGANYPSQLLSKGLFFIESQLDIWFQWLGVPGIVTDALVHGVFRVLAWVVSVMLPPMAIFFPLFTLLEDSGYLPRMAFNLDKCFHCCRACGKQALTMAMGFGCNAAGVVGCRIIDSKRERLIAILTNCFVPCNGRFPMMLTIITIFFATGSGLGASLFSALFMGGLILIGILMTFLVSRILSATLLKGVPSSFTLELPSYRRPQIGKVLVRSILDRTLFVLGRAAAIAAPAGLILWIFSNLMIGESTLLAICAGALDPFGKLLGMDGVIILAFLLGLPANEIVLPIILMAYLSEGTLMEAGNILFLKQVLIEHGWTWLTAVNLLLFSLMHWPCSTTCITMKKETQSWKWTLVGIGIPTAAGITVCFLFTTITRLILGFF